MNWWESEMKNPPKKLSKLIRLALNDLSKVERSSRHRVDMKSWHHPVYLGKSLVPTCYVCFAGSVMSKTLKCDLESYQTPENFSDPWIDAFRILDAVREGYLPLKVQDYGIDSHREVPQYKSGNSPWRKAMWKIVKELESVGL